MEVGSGVDADALAVELDLRFGPTRTQLQTELGPQLQTQQAGLVEPSDFRHLAIVDDGRWICPQTSDSCSASTGGIFTDMSAITCRPNCSLIASSRLCSVTPSALARAATSANNTAAVMPSLSSGRPPCEPASRPS